MKANTHKCSDCIDTTANLGTASKLNRLLTGGFARFWAVFIFLNSANRPEPDTSGWVLKPSLRNVQMYDQFCEAKTVETCVLCEIICCSDNVMAYEDFSHIKVK